MADDPRSQPRRDAPDFPPDGQSGLVAAVDAQELARLRALAEEHEQLREQVLRANADLQNVRRRSERDADDRYWRRVEGLLLSVLDSIDQLERASATAAEAGQDSLAAGIGLIRDRLREAAAREGVKEIASVGTPFDPKLHEAVTSVSDPEAEPGAVVAEQRKGYVWGDRVLRPARVIVAAAGRAPSAEATD
jgi:molecular chaperone GrpE